MAPRRSAPLAALLALLSVPLWQHCGADITTQLFWTARTHERLVLAERPQLDRLRCAAACLRMSSCVASQSQSQPCLLLGGRVSPGSTAAQQTAVADLIKRPECPSNWTPWREACYIYDAEDVEPQSVISACDDLHSSAHPVSIASAEEMDFVINLSDNKNIVLGLFRPAGDISANGDTSSWTWSDGTPLNVSYFPDGEPKNDADRLYILRSSNNDWKAKKATDKAHMVCKLNF